MSLYFERALSRFDPDAAETFDVADAGGENGSATVDADALATLLGNRAERLKHPDREGWWRVPLHEADSAELSGAAVDVEDHPLRGTVFAYCEDGEEVTLTAADLDGTALADRLRFWLPDAIPDERPSYVGDNPTTRVSPARRPEAAPGDYLDRLTDRLEDERAAVRERNRERARHHSPGELYAKGEDAVPRLEKVVLPGDGTVRVHAVPPDGDTSGDIRDHFHLFGDDEVLLQAEDPAAPDAFPVEGVVQRFARFAVDLSVRVDEADRTAVESFLERAAPSDLGLTMLLNPVTYDRQQAALDALRADSSRLDLLTGRRDATFAAPTGRNTALRDTALDASQVFAATCALYADDVCCIHGPPGTGKTRVLTEVVRRAVADGNRVLVTADSNQGVDNLLVGASTPDEADPHSLHAHADDELSISRHRAGNSDRSLVEDVYGDADDGRADVVAATNSGAAEFETGAFDLAVVDEATQSTVASTLVPVTRADRAVLAGDHHQLPPYEPGVEVPPDRHHSLFERLYAADGIFGARIGVRLDTQYRMHEAIAAFPSEQFYEGTLRNGTTVPPVDDLPPLVGVDVDGTERRNERGSYDNAEEAECVRDVADRLLEAGLDPGEIGVVTPYDAQIGTIREQLGSESGAIEVDTIDAFQGSERDAVVVSFVRSNDDGDLGFLAREGDGPRRLNVALTRAERFCALVGDWSTLGGCHRTDAATDLYRDLRSHLEERGLLVEDVAAIETAGE